VLSGNGRYVEFYAYAQLTADDHNGTMDVYRRDATTGELVRISPDPTYGADQNSTAYCGMSEDGAVTAFQTSRSYHANDTNRTTDVYIRRLPDGPITWVSANTGGASTWSGSRCYAISRDGTAVLFDTDSAQVVPGDTNGQTDLFVATVRRDTTAPVVTPRPERAPNAAGWYNAPVVLRWDAIDPDSNVPPTAPQDTVAATEGANVRYTSAPSCDAAGNCATATTTISLDTHPPVITVTGIAADTEYLLGAAPKAGCTAADALSGVLAGCSGTVLGGTSSGVGTFVYEATASDVAGNTATKRTSYQVHCSWTGFMEPIGSPGHTTKPGASVFKAGSTVPVKFQLTDATGSVVAPGVAPTWTTPQRLGPIGGPISDPGNADLPSSADAYRLSDTTWIYNWATKGLTAGYYYRIGVRLDDGTTRTAVVGLR
jgi:hypothetical protein